MKRFLQRLMKFTAYLAAALVIVLAVAVGLFRLLLPRLPEYQDEIKSWANAAIGMQVEFSGMNARWRLSGPELNFYNAELALPGTAGGAFAADEVTVGVELARLLLDRTLVVDRIVVRDSTVSVVREETGAWRVQDVALGTLAERFAARRRDGAMTLIAEDIDVSYRHRPAEQPVPFMIDSLRLTRTPARVDVDVALLLPEDLGNRMRVSASRRATGPGSDATWQFMADGSDLDLAGWSGLQPAAWPVITAGTADVSLAVEHAAGRVRNAVADFRVTDLAAGDEPAPFTAAARLEFERDGAGWLLVADDLQLRTPLGAWPSTSLTLQAGNAPGGGISSLAVTAGFIELGDLALFRPWLPDAWRQRLAEYDPSGRLVDLQATLAELGTETPRYDVSLGLREAGFRGSGSLPGVRGFSGTLRANRSGGRVEIDAGDMQLDLSSWLEATVPLDSARGTVIWRENRDGVIVLSDSIQVQNEDLTSRSSVQLSLPADESSPVLDLESRWSIYDLGAARRYLPAKIMNPGLHRWLGNALVAGRVPSGTTRFSGPLDAFPFDDGQGIFRIEAELQDATLRYSEQWPAVENLDLDLIVDRTRLYSNENTAINAGNAVTDAEIEIADLRQPVLTIDAFATGTMDSIRRFVRQSPIANVFGGHLDRVNVAGDASFSLDLTYPILNRRDYAFETRIQATDGTLRIAGFEPPVTELNGFVTVTRDSIESDSLFGRFLGEPVTIGLRRAGDDAPGYSVHPDIDGRFSRRA
ncbi:MAG: DUF3971 domain-containing protein [Woeseiaceae bacterium]|nr:DUF3971 domain-containing protein [Woeseiaceae bacterium]